LQVTGVWISRRFPDPAITVPPKATIDNERGTPLYRPRSNAQALEDIGARQPSDIGGLAVLHGEPVQVAAVLRREPVDEGRPPQLTEAAARRERGEAVEPGRREDWGARGILVDVMDVEIARYMAGGWREEGVMAVPTLARAEEVLEPPELADLAHPEPSATGPEAHLPLEAAFEDREATIGLQADQEHLARLVGGAGEAGADPRQPASPRNQIPEGQDIGTVTADGADETRRCHSTIIERPATAIIPIRKNGRPWKRDCPAAIVRNETLRATRHYGRAFWRRSTGYHIRSRIEAKMRCLKAFGKRIAASDPNRQTAQIQIRIALMNCLSALGTAQIIRVA
jgi:hypothetical protein